MKIAFVLSVASTYGNHRVKQDLQPHSVLFLRFFNAKYARCSRKNMVRMHNPKSNRPRYQTGKLGSHRNSTPMTRQREIVRMPQRTSLFPGWDLKISPNT